MLGTAGHVDHGKSALVKLLTGCETDTLAEEKERGLTIDLGFARCRLADERIVGVVDVPGHVDFIRNMVAGAHGVDVVIFVVAADDGIMPQTREHLQILSLMGLRHGVVALTKVDLVDSARRDEVTRDLGQLFAGTFLANARICPISNLTGDGFEPFFDALNEAAAACAERSAAGIFRVWIEDVFTLRGPGTVVTGIPSSGQVAAGDSLTLLPGGFTTRVRRMQVYGENATQGGAGECVALNMPEVEHDKAKRGMVLCGPDMPDPGLMAEAELAILDSIKGEVDDLLEAHVHVGTASTMAHIAMLESSGMKAGDRQMVQLRFAEPLPVVPGERFVIRANLPGEGQGGLVTAGGGRIVALTNVRLRRNKRWTLEMLRARRDALDLQERWCELMLSELNRPLTLAQLLPKCLLRREELEAVLRSLETAGRLVRLRNGLLAHQQTIEAAGRKMLAAMDAFHAANPQHVGMARDPLCQAVGAAPEVCEFALKTLLERGQFHLAGAVYSRAGWAPRVSDQDQRLAEAISAAFQKAGSAGPAAAELSATLQQPVPRIEKAMRLLSERGVLVRLDDRTFVHRDAVESARQVVLRLFADKRSFSTMDFRDALGVSRKYAVPLLDHMDKLRFTVRSGNERTPGAEAKKILGL
jgi:selenocysteine-specific elongation factor